MAISNDLGISQAGYVVFDGVTTFTGRTFQAGAGISLANPSGIAGNTTISASASVPTSFVSNSGMAVPASSILNVLGGTGITTAGSGNTLTISLTGGGAIETITGNTGGPESPLAGNFNILGTGSITVAGSANTETVQLTGLTNHAVQVGAGTATLTQLAIGTTGQVLTGVTGADPVWASPAASTITLTGTTGGALGPSNSFTLLGGTVAAGTVPVAIAGSGTTLTTNIQKSQAIAATDATKIGLANFDSAAFDVDANGFVQLNGGGIAATSFAIQANTAPGTNPVVPTAAGLVTINGAAVANHSVVLETRSRAANTYNLEVQYAAAAAATDATKSGVAHFNSAQFSVDANGFVSSTAVATDLHDSRFIVSTGGTVDGANYTTIASAITAAVSAGGVQTVFIQPGTYTENLTLSPNINLCAHTCDFTSPNVTIIGKMSYSSAGTVSISGINFQDNNDNILTVTGAAASIVNFENCNFAVVNNIVALSCSSSGAIVRLITCRGNLGSATASLFAFSGGVLNIFYTSITNTSISTTANTFSNGSSCSFEYSILNFSITTSNTSSFGAFNTQFINGGGNTTILTIGGTGTNFVQGSLVESGTASAISVGTGATLLCTKCTISSLNTNAITGAGSITYGDLTFDGTSSLINTTTQIPLVRSNDAVTIKTPGAYPYTTVPQDAVILIDTASARTITPLASPTTGQRHTIKDNVGSAAANNITITPSGKNIDGSASFVINTNWGSADIVYNGTQWNLL